MKYTSATIASLAADPGQPDSPSQSTHCKEFMIYIRNPIEFGTIGCAEDKLHTQGMHAGGSHSKWIHKQIQAHQASQGDA